jgi:ABC-2 type transport system ATP-binding protein
MSQPNGASAPNREVLLADKLRKEYGARVALKNLSFSLKAGRVLGFLGPNGAGKTTAIRILTTMLAPTAGYFEVAGIRSDHPEQIRRKIGVLPEGLGFPKHTSGRDYLTYFGQLFGQPVAMARANADRLLADTGMQHRGDALVGTYSHGMRQRLGIARALVNDPHVIFLDEPTLGLDPRGQAELLALIKRVARERDTGVVLCSHALAEIEGVCDDLIIMNSGEMVAYGTVAQVTGQQSPGDKQGNAVKVRVAALAVDSASRALIAAPGVLHVTIIDAATGLLAVELQGHPGANGASDQLARNRVLEALLRADVPVLGFESVGGRLQDVFLQLTAESIG